MHASANLRDRIGRPEHFGLTGRSVKLDRRVHAVRGDIADIALAGTIFAPHYAVPMIRYCIADNAPMRSDGNDEAVQISTLLLGEEFAVIDLGGGWAWGYSVHDHCVGYVREDALGTSVTGHWKDQFTPSTDIAHNAEQLLDTPYLMGGRGLAGTNCTGLVQIACALADKSIPRESDQQIQHHGPPLPKNAVLQRSDIAYFADHGIIMVSPDRAIHASAEKGQVVIEPLSDIIAQYEAADVPDMIAFRL